MIENQRVAHVTTVHHPLDPRIYLKEVATLRQASIETWLIAREASGSERIDQFLGLSDGKGPFNRLRRHAQSYRHLRKLKPAIVHIHDPELIPVSYLGRRTIGCKVIYDMHENYTGRKKRGGRILRMLESWCFRWVDHVVLAESSYESILKGRSTPSTAILNYILPPASAPEKDGDTRFTLIYTGTISNCRGLGHMLDLAGEIKRAGLPWRIKIVGVSHLPAERMEAERRIREEELGSVLERVGWDTYVPWGTLVEHYAHADVGLALFEPLPNHTGSVLSKFYEYIYFSIPVVCSDFSLWRAFFEANGCGMTVRPNDAGRVLALINGLVDGEGYERLAVATRSARDRYLWSAMEPRLTGLYRDLFDPTLERPATEFSAVSQATSSSME